MKSIRVMVVDDSVVVRRLLREALGSNAMIEIAGIAANGRIALSMLDSVNPDVVTLDVEMPELNGLETLKEIRRRRPQLPVIMFSSLTERGATATLDALALGASDYVTKPSNSGDPTAAIDLIRGQLLPKVVALCQRQENEKKSAARTAVLPSKLTRPTGPPTPVTVVAIGTSTGGPNALAQVLPLIPSNFPVPILVVQHMPATFTRFLAERLANSSAVAVQEGRDRIQIKPAEVWIAPGDYHMTVARENGPVFLQMNREPPENSCRPAVDVLFRSVARVYGKGALALVLTGMGQDGGAGAAAIREAGGRVIVQDEGTSVVWGMPGYVAQAGLADRVLPLPEIAGELIRRVCHAAAAAGR